MSISGHVGDLVVSMLRDRRMLVWYDPDRVFHELFRGIGLEPLVKVDASESVLCARREADLAWRALFDTDSFGPQPAPLLIYVPAGRGHPDDEEARRTDPFEPFALCGAAFGDTEAEHLPSIARRALAGREAEVDRLFAEWVRSLAQIQP